MRHLGRGTGSVPLPDHLPLVERNNSPRVLAVFMVSDRKVECRVQRISVDFTGNRLIREPISHGPQTPVRDGLDEFEVDGFELGSSWFEVKLDGTRWMSRAARLMSRRHRTGEVR